MVHGPAVNLPFELDSVCIVLRSHRVSRFHSNWRA